MRRAANSPALACKQTPHRPSLRVETNELVGAGADRGALQKPSSPTRSTYLRGAIHPAHVQEPLFEGTELQMVRGLRKTFEIAQCKVMSNARGYYRHEY